MINASKLWGEALLTCLTWWKIRLAHEGGGIKVTTEIRSQTIYYRWLRHTGKPAVSTPPEEESLQTFTCSPCKDSYITCYRNCLFASILHTLVCFSWEQFLKLDMVLSRCGRDYGVHLQKHMLKIGHYSTLLFQFMHRYNRHQRRMWYCWKTIY